MSSTNWYANNAKFKFLYSLKYIIWLDQEQEQDPTLFGINYPIQQWSNSVA